MKIHTTLGDGRDECFLVQLWGASGWVMMIRMLKNDENRQQPKLR